MIDEKCVAQMINLPSDPCLVIAKISYTTDFSATIHFKLWLMCWRGLTFQFKETLQGLSKQLCTCAQKAVQTRSIVKYPLLNNHIKQSLWAYGRQEIGWTFTAFTWLNDTFELKPHLIIVIMDIKIMGRAWNSSRPLAIFRTIFPIWPSKSNLVGHIYCIFPMEKPLIVFSNVPAFKEWPTNFKLLFQALMGTHIINLSIRYWPQLNSRYISFTGIQF